MYFVETIFALILFSMDSLYKTFLWESAYYGIIASVIGSVWDMFVQSSLRRLRAIPSSLLQFLSYPFLKQPSWQWSLLDGDSNSAAENFKNEYCGFD